MCRGFCSVGCALVTAAGETAAAAARAVSASWERFLTVYPYLASQRIEQLQTAWAEARTGALSAWTLRTSPGEDGSDGSSGDVSHAPADPADLTRMHTLDACELSRRVAQLRQRLKDARADVVSTSAAQLQDEALASSPHMQPVVSVEWCDESEQRAESSGREHAARWSVAAKANGGLASAVQQQRCSDTDATSTEHVVLQLEEEEKQREEKGWPRVIQDVRVERPRTPCTASTTHVCVFVHGLLGHATDLQLWRNFMITLNPEMQSLLSATNEDRSTDDLAQQGHRLALEVRTELQRLCGKDAALSLSRCGTMLCFAAAARAARCCGPVWNCARVGLVLTNRLHMWAEALPLPESKHDAVSHPRHIRRLSFVGHSIGNLVIRVALTDDALKVNDYEHSLRQ